MAEAQPERVDVRTARIRRRLFLACTCIVLGLFTLQGAYRFNVEREAALTEEAETQARFAQAAADQTNAAIAHAWGVLAGAAELAHVGDLIGSSPGDVARAAGKARAVAGAVVIAADGHVLAAPRPGLITAAEAGFVQMKDEPSWAGVVRTPGGARALVLARHVDGAAVISVFDAQAMLPEPAPGARVMFVAPDGGVLGARPAIARSRANIADALDLRANGAIAEKAVFRERTISGGDIAVGSAALDTGGLRLYAAAPAAPLFEPMMRVIGGNLLIYGAPLFAALLLLRLWLRQSERADTAEDELVVTRDRFRLAVDGARAGVFEWRLDHDTVEVSERIVRQLQAPSEVMRFDTFLSLIAVEDRPAAEESFNRARETGVLEVGFRMRGPGGVTWAEARGLAIEDPQDEGAVSIVGTIIDVTPRREAELRAMALERRLREAIDSYSGPFALWDGRKRLVMWNRSYARSFNLPASALKPGATYEAVTAAAAKEVNVTRQDPSDPQIQEVELKTGLWLQLVERRTAEGGLVTVGADITALKRQEEALARSQRNLRSMVAQLETSEGRNKELARKYEEEKRRAEEASHAKSAFLANMSHELRTPLNAINGFSELMVSEIFGPLGDKHYQEYAKDILASGQLLLDLINDILDMAKIESGKITLTPAPLSPLEAVNSAVRLMRRRAEEKKLSLVVDAQDTPDIEADHRAVKQMLLNLLSNAIKFTEEGGVIVRIRPVAAANGAIEGVNVSVVDTGPGIPEEHLPRLGRPFEQVDMRLSRKTGGTGLGLALTKSLAEMHGGRLAIDSELGKGTIVSLYMPVAARVSPSALASATG
jgi:two-component system cell cycle sensor histidine kinase PleC